MNLNRARDLAGRSFRWVLQFGRDEATIDKDDAAARFEERGKDLIALPSTLRCRAEKNLFVVQEDSLIGDVMEFHAPGVFETARGSARGRRYRRLSLRDQILFPMEPLNLPGTQCKQQHQRRRGEDRRPEQRAKPGHLTRSAAGRAV